MSQKITQLEAAIQANNAELQAALAAGDDTAKIRAEAARLNAELQGAHDAQAAANRAEQADEEKAVAEVVTVVIEREIAAVAVSSSAIELERLTGEQMPAVEADPELEHAAAQVARAQIALTKAEAEHKPHRQQFLQLSDRLQAKRRAAEVIKTRRATGNEQPTDAADLAMLAADAEALELMVGDSRINADTCAPTSARAALASAEATLQYARKQATFRAAKAQVQQLEAAFVAAWRHMVDTGRAVGMGSPWAEFKASPEMTRAVTGAIVAGYRGQL